MKWVLLCLLALQVPIDAPLSKPADRDAHERRREAIETMNAGVHRHLRGDFEPAREALERAVELDSDYSRAHVNLGRLYVELGRSEAAEAELVRAIELIDLEQGRLGPLAKSETTQALAELRGQVHSDLGHLLFERLEREPDPASSRREELARRAIEALTEAAILRAETESTRPDFRAHHERGLVHDLLDEGLEADRSYRACIESQPDYGPCYADLARLYFDYGAFDMAEAVVETGLAVTSISAELWLVSAQLHLDRKRPKEAAVDAKKAVTIDPDLADAWWVRGMAHADLRERKEAIEALNHYLHRAIAPSLERRNHATTVLARLMDPI